MRFNVMWPLIIVGGWIYVFLVILTHCDTMTNPLKVGTLICYRDNANLFFQQVSFTSIRRSAQ